MPDRISASKRAALIHDLVHANFDLTRLEDAYGVSPESLSQWVLDESNRRTLTGLCVLADIQTQLLMSRYRLIAAGRLIDMATNPPEDTKAGLDIARRACVDLLKLDLPRASSDNKRRSATAPATPDDGLKALQAMIDRADDEDRTGTADD